MTLVDTPIWSLAMRRLRRRPSTVEVALLGNWMDLVRRGEAALIGAVRQELLTGIRDDTQCERLAQHLAAFEDLALEREDFVLAARYANRCRAQGVQGSPTDFLLCAAADRRGLDVFTTDDDFPRYARILPIRLRRV